MVGGEFATEVLCRFSLDKQAEKAAAIEELWVLGSRKRRRPAYDMEDGY